MSREKMEWAIYSIEDENKYKEIYYEDLDREEYEEKYKKNLSCINGCIAGVKFTHKKNNVKFFSTWNGDGEKHKEGCPFHVKYKGKMGRLRLKAFYEKREINDEDIKRTLLNKIRGLKRKYNGEEENKAARNSMEIEENGEMIVKAEDAEGTNTNNRNRARREHNIMSSDANYLSMIDVGTRRCVYGIGNTAQIDNKKGEYFGYINLKNRGYTVAVYFPKSFYSQENGITLDDFNRLFNILKLELNDNQKKCVIVCYGEIGRKEKKGVNINIINEAHIYINDMSVRQILSEGKLKEINYEII
ncbi:hypothetical protein [Clostridium sp. YIM B02555]|uniref:hypothetical protein n=1 Tax=Clostridium sp. YIM B02555 TaxID=2911968 RepID=UPI001EECFD24|nr:hypothetical protein [Clostridium sp. YIM B02555]